MFAPLRIIAAAAVMAPLLASPAHAGLFSLEPAESGLYISGFVGGGFPSDADFEGTQNPDAGVNGAVGAPANVEADLDGDVFYGAAIGGKLPFKYWKYFHPRLELEVSYQENDVTDGSFNGGDQNFEGSQSRLFVTANNYADIIWKDNQRIVPYFGGGIGFGVVDNSILYGPATATAPTVGLEGQDTGFATISALGLTAKITDKIDLYTEGRYHKIYGIDVDRRFIANDGFNAAVDDNPDGFTLTVGTRYNF